MLTRLLQGWSVLVFRGDTAGLSLSLMPSYPGSLILPCPLGLSPPRPRDSLRSAHRPQMSPLLGVAAVNSLLFTAYGASRRIVSPFPDLTVPQIALAGSMAGAANAVLASPVGATVSSDRGLLRSMPLHTDSSSDILQCSPTLLHTIGAGWSGLQRAGAG